MTVAYSFYFNQAHQLKVGLRLFKSEQSPQNVLSVIPRKAKLFFVSLGLLKIQNKLYLT